MIEADQRVLLNERTRIFFAYGGLVEANTGPKDDDIWPLILRSKLVCSRTFAVLIGTVRSLLSPRTIVSTHTCALYKAPPLAIPRLFPGHHHHHRLQRYLPKLHPQLQ